MVKTFRRITVREPPEGDLGFQENYPGQDITYAVGADGEECNVERDKPKPKPWCRRPRCNATKGNGTGVTGRSSDHGINPRSHHK
ncbi:hypothetical protein CMUS01_14958 [Colletotrichum musicola]|uniref:Uncharacterized protein n=1 Tax=Colletotrichum musicola TaxID=2175873 RepID=A0A8H6IZX4_9PEZI|nr:hypothetical protein CMUS01_14958 [Colletotrichum musicola]